MTANETSATRGAVSAATVGATVMIAHQVAGKATRDAMFLSHFPVSDLPTMLIGAALVSIVVVLGVARVMAHRGPGRLVPAIFFASAALSVGEWLLVARHPRPVAVFFYLHVAALGAVLISGFWSMINERFDPHTAKRSIGRIAGGATLGGLFGGLLAERVAALAGADLMLIFLAILHLGCGLAVLRLRVPGRHVGGHDEPDAAAVETLRRNGHLRSIAVLVLLVTLSASFLDFAFKATAALRYDEDELLRFFAIFYTGMSALTFLVQAALARPALQRLGLARTVATLPVAVAVGGIGALLAPGLMSASAAYAGEGVLRGSLFRSGYELLFTPIEPRDKRATKTIIDVGVDRLGDILGGGTVRLLLVVVAPALAIELLMGAAVLLGLLAAALALRLQRGYVHALEASLFARASELDLEQEQAAAERSSVMQTIGAINLTQALGARSPYGADLLSSGWALREHASLAPAVTATPRAEPDPPAADAVDPAISAPVAVVDPTLARISALRSGDATRVRLALDEGPLDPASAAHVIPLLAWDVVSSAAVRALQPIAERITGQLVDALLDPEEAFAVRRRVPRVLSAARNPRAVAGLFAGLDDRRFEVRFQCGRALAVICAAAPSLAPPRERVFQAVRHELDVDRRVWESRKLLDPDDAGSLFADAALRAIASHSLEHLFTVLSLALPREPLNVAFRGLQTDDDTLRGTALEYLDSVLPGDVRDAAWRLLQHREGRPRRQTGRPDALHRLMQSKASIDINLADLRKRLLGE